MNRLDLWPKAFSDAFHLRKSEVRQRDEAEKLTTEDFRAFVDSNKAKEIREEYVRLADNPNEAVDIMKFAELRDYLLLLVITASGQRWGAAGNLTVGEFRNGVHHSEDLYITRTLRHKTSAGGHAKLMWDAELKRMVNTYLDVLWPMFANDRSVIAATAGIPAMPAFFISAAGQPMNESMVLKRIIAMGKKLKPNLPGNLRGSRLRKGIVMLQRTDEAPTISPRTLAKQMSHSVATAQTYYYVEEEAQSDARVASYLKSLFQPKQVT